MKAAFHYAVKIKLFNYHSKDNLEFIVAPYFSEFYDDSPIVAREKAFTFYQNWLDVLLEGIGKKYSTDRQAREDLKAFLTPNSKLNLTFGQNEIDLSNSVSVGIGVYFIIDTPTEPIYIDENLNDCFSDEDLIHGIGNSSEFNDPSSFAFFLENEFEYYCNNGYDTKSYKRHASCYDWQISEVKTFEFLETPFDWSGLDTPDNPDLHLKVINSYEDIITKGEGDGVEFKPALLYNFKTDKPGISVKAKIATAICAFLNSKGGLLFIGLNDNGKPQGLEKDFSLAESKKPKDFFHQEFDNMINHFLSFSLKSSIHGQFYELEGKEIFIVTVEPSRNRPIFLKGQNGKEFWVRGNHGNRQLSDIEELANYCIDRWTKSDTE